MGKESGPKRLAACLPAHLTSALSSRMDEDSRLQHAWRTCVSGPLASHARPVRYTAGLLFIHADTPAWASRLRHQQASLIATLRRAEEFRDLAALRFRVVPRASPGQAIAAAESRPSRLSAEAAKAVAQTASTINDPVLRAALERLSRSAGGSRASKRRR